MVIEPDLHADDRGFFCETFREQWGPEVGIPPQERFLQDNHSRSARGVVRGMHFHVGPGVAKLVRCARGQIVDVAVDLRRGSPTYAQWEAVELDDASMRELYPPVGFAHGFCVTCEQADVIYKQSAYYDPQLRARDRLRRPRDRHCVAAAGAGADRVERDANAPTLAQIASEPPFQLASLGAMSSRLQRLRERTNGYTVTAQQYVYFAYAALVALTLDSSHGRCRAPGGSGTGCPTWPKCYGNVYPPLNSHAVIEFSNRALTAPVFIAAGLAWVAALRRRPYRRDLAWLSGMLPLGVVGQAVLGGFRSRGRARLRLGDGALRALDADPRRRRGARVARRHEPQESVAGRSSRAMTARRPASTKPVGPCCWCGVFAGWSPFGALTIFAGTAATAAGPHAGGSPGQRMNRLDFDGRATMDFVIHRHAEIAFAFSLAAVLVWWLARSARAASAWRRP